MNAEVAQITDYTSHIPQLSWENDPGEEELYNILTKNPALFLTASSKQFRKLTHEPSLPQRRLSLPKAKSFKPYLAHYSKEKLQTFSIEDLNVLRKRKTKFTSAFSISSPYLPESLQQSSLCSVLGNLKYCSSFDAASFVLKRIRGKAFLRMRRSILNFIRSVSQLNRAYTLRDMSLALTRGLRELTQRVPNDLNIQRSLQCLVLDSIFPEQRRRRTTKRSPKYGIRRVMDKIVRSQDLVSLVLKKESIQNLLQNQEELQRLVENLPKLKEFVLGVDFGYRTFWAPQFKYGLASRITCFHMRYKSGSHGQEPKSPLFDFLNNIDAFANLRSFRYEESEGIHWNHPDVMQELEKLNRFQRVPLKEIHLNMFFGSQEPSFEHIISGFFQNLALPTTTEKITFYARFHNLALLQRAQGYTQCFEPFKSLANLQSFDLSLITDTLITDLLTKEEQPGFLIHFFQQALQHLNPELHELSLTAIKSCDLCSKRIFQDDQLLCAIAKQFKSLKSLSLEFPPGTIDLSYAFEETPLTQLESLSVTGCRLPLEFCRKLNPEKFAALVYNAPKGIELQNLLGDLDAISCFTFLKQLALVFTGCDQYDIRGEVLDKTIKIFQKLSSLTDFTMYLDVRVKRNVLDWLMKLANSKKRLTNCRLNFYHYGLVKPYLISKEDYWIKSHMERTRKFLMN